MLVNGACLRFAEPELSWLQDLAGQVQQFRLQHPCLSMQSIGASSCSSREAYLFKDGFPYSVFDKGDVNGPKSIEPFVVAKNHAKGHDTGLTSRGTTKSFDGWRWQASWPLCLRRGSAQRRALDCKLLSLPALSE